MRCVRLAGALALGIGLALGAGLAPRAGAEGAAGWLRWRGPEQSGASAAKGLPIDLAPTGPHLRWTYPLCGRGTAVAAGDRVYVMGYRGQGADLQEVLACLDLATGRPLWERGWSDFLSDIIYERYSIGAPTIDAETGNVYALTSPGLLVALSADGAPLWEISLLEMFGRLTFPNGRTGSPALDGDLVIVNAITASWGAEGPARNRFYAFEKRTGALVWTSTPGITPVDSSFSTPVFAWRGGRRVFYAGTGCGHVVCIDARSGAPVWRFRVSAGGVNATPLLVGDRLVAIHGQENLEDSTTGGMVALDVGGEVGKDGVLAKSAERWTNDLSMFTSSPTAGGGRIYQMTAGGELCQVDPESGRVRWRHRLAPSQLHASPLWAEGRLYVPLWDGHVYVVEPADEGAKVLSQAKLEGSCLGSPSTHAGRLFIHTTEKLYCFGAEAGAAGGGAASGGGSGEPPAAEVAAPEGFTPTLHVVPAEVVLRVGESIDLGLFLSGPARLERAGGEVAWERVPPPEGAPPLGASIDASGRVTAERPSAGLVRARLGDRTATARIRVVDARLAEGFDKATLAQKALDGGAFAFPPGAWLGGRLKWEVRELDGDKVLAKTLDQVLFQRSQVFVGHPKERGYTIEADVRTDGNRRLMSNVGVICQRYAVLLEGNWQELQVMSNHDRVKVGIPFAWKAGRWYRIRARVDDRPEGGVIVRASAWPRGEEPPAAWMLEVPLAHGHREGAPGLYGFAPQSRHKVYIDNVAVYPSTPAPTEETGK